MAGSVGRANTLTWGGVTLAGVREKSFAINGAPVDETSGEDNGWRTLLTTPGEKTVDLTISGVIKSKTLATDFFAGNTQKAVVYTRADGSTITGVFMLTDYSMTDPYKEASTFEASFQSTGVVTYAAN